jgi:hypothetical protein
MKLRDQEQDAAAEPEKEKQRFLRKRVGGGIFGYTDQLADRQDIIECNRDGSPINGVDPSADQLADVQEELARFRASADGMTFEAHEAEVAVLNERVADLEGEVEGKDKVIEDLQAKLAAALIEPTGLELLDDFMKGLAGKPDGEAKGSLEDFVKQAFGVDLDKRVTLAKMVENARDAASKGG